MTNYQSAVERLNKADTPEKLLKLEASFDRLYDAGQLTVSEFSRLCTKVMEKVVKLEITVDNQQTTL